MTTNQRARLAVNKLYYKRGWSTDDIQRRIYDCYRAARTDEARARLIEIDELTRS